MPSWTDVPRRLWRRFCPCYWHRLGREFARRHAAAGAYFAAFYARAGRPTDA